MQIASPGANTDISKTWNGVFVVVYFDPCCPGNRWRGGMRGWTHKATGETVVEYSALRMLRAMCVVEAMH